MTFSARYKLLKELRFRRADGSVLPVKIPENLNQSLLRNAILDDYLVMTVATGRQLAESEVCTLKSGNSIVGFLIPGQAILSPDQQLNSEPMYGTYSLIAAIKVCDNSFKNNIELPPPPLASIDSANAIFHEDIFYLVVWLKKLGISAADFSDDYFVSLARHGINPSPDGRRPLLTQRTLQSYGQSIQLYKNKKWPSYVRTIISELEPYATDPFLRFFYLYQVIETLMSVNFKSELEKIRTTFNAQSDISITQLRDYVVKFQKTYKEKTRINNVLQPICPRSYESVVTLLDALGELDKDDTFSEKIYKVRNIIFHDYQRAHPFSKLVADLEEDLVSYILEKKLA